jgi:ribosomal protein L14E/L6E/L27E
MSSKDRVNMSQRVQTPSLMRRAKYDYVETVLNTNEKAVKREKYPYCNDQDDLRQEKGNIRVSPKNDLTRKEIER